MSFSFLTLIDGAPQMWLGFVSLMLIKLMRYLGDKANGVLTLRVKVCPGHDGFCAVVHCTCRGSHMESLQQTNQKISVEALNSFIATRSIEVSDAVSDPVSQSKKTSWIESDTVLWRGEPPKIEVLYDETNEFLLLVLFQVNMKNTQAEEGDFINIFFDILRVRYGGG